MSKIITLAKADDGSEATLTPLEGGSLRVESRGADGRVVFADEEMGPYGAAALSAHFGDDLPKLLALAGDNGDVPRHAPEEPMTTAELSARIYRQELLSCCDRNGYVQEERVADLAARSGVPYTVTRTAVDQALAGALPRQGTDDAKIRSRMRERNIEYAEAASELAAAGELKEV